MQIIERTQDDADFWALMGPWFASEEVYRVRGGYPMFSSPSMKWLIAVEDGAAVAWVAIDGDRLRFAHTRSDACSLPTIIEHALAMCSGEMKMTAHKDRMVGLQDLGFTVVSTRGSYVIMKKS